MGKLQQDRGPPREEQDDLPLEPEADRFQN
jgi:hypothetical protein